MNYDVIVVGGGHAGCEAALASARSGLKTALFTIYLDTIAMMSCNPSIGGPGKSHIVAEVDILGGEIGKHTDKYNLQLKHLNTSKGPAARITRGQADKYWYRVKMKEMIENTPNLDSIQGTIEDIIIENGQIKGVISDLGIKYGANSVILATGTFLKGRVVIGDVKYPAGRIGEKSAEKLSDALIKNGIILDRYQTATPPRLDMRTVDFSKMKEMHGEDNPKYFSLFTKKEKNNNAPTWLTYTTPETVKVAQDLLQYSPIVSGIIETHGPRHCPSLDRKVLNFPEKTNHQIFLELESKETNELYVNGLTTAMPPFAQEKMMRTIAGLENAKIMRYGYAVEYDYAPSYQLYPSLESKKIKNLYFAGQINGTSGYEEAAAQGFLAGVNASRKVLGKEPVIIDRTEGYLGVLVDDIIHKKTPEPYRVLPSRAEYRLTLRFDNAFMRLIDKAKEIGIVSEDKIKFLEEARETVKYEVERINQISISMKRANEVLESVDAKDRFGKGVKLSELLKQKEVTYDSLGLIIEIKELPVFVKNQIETIVKYNAFIEREKMQIEKFRKLESMKIPEGFKFETIAGLSNIARDGLEQIKPMSIGEATRISGVTGNDIAILITNLENIK
ncbi:tRNA uridine-5-carboxymethylaminomethyl(34) synthesis enzyme MnmG [Psychrilyobacter atlanticus]|uniref:tRNA uridine-5-carboxymethylaminomethyl(34) synthesis enzyme MnmG n=1 Tax=Psychrilyobacter atlanticus TaxID=271091 RepID=UPI000420D1CA|nr:tRNA uridine-5-carboxymethylaminomethyl(34) synthesis enzyme MnmG [Psychrilyobacter atlanticus]